MNSSSFLVMFSAFYVYSIMSSANSDSFTFSFPVSIPFISSFFLIVVPRISKSILSESGESGPPCLLSDLWGNAFSFSPLSIMLAVGLSHMVLLCRGMFLLCLLSRHVFTFFPHKWPYYTRKCIDLMQSLSKCQWDFSETQKNWF